MSWYDIDPPQFLKICRCGELASEHTPWGYARKCPYSQTGVMRQGDRRPLYRPDYDRVMRAYLTHRRATHYSRLINFDRRKGWDDLTQKVDCPTCNVMERQLARARKKKD
jgi:hypothetical protein